MNERVFNMVSTQGNENLKQNNILHTFIKMAKKIKN